MKNENKEYLIQFLEEYLLDIDSHNGEFIDKLKEIIDELNNKMNIEKQIETMLKENNFDIVECFGMNNSYGIRAFSKDRIQNISVSFDELVDDEVVEEFEEQLKDYKEWKNA